MDHSHAPVLNDTNRGEVQIIAGRVKVAPAPLPTALLALLAIAALMLTGGPVQAQAAASARAAGASSEEAARREVRHAMGSQIRKHEGGNLSGKPQSQGEFVRGVDVSSHQGTVDWQHWWDQGMRFAYVKATEGTGYTNPYFAQQYNGSYWVGMIRGAYHFALPNVSSGAAQARYFVQHGGGWSPDGKTLPGALDIEYNPYGPTCYGMSPSEMGAWIKDFSDTYHALTGRYPTIYTSTNWWQQCVSPGSKPADFSRTSPLWIARYNEKVGALPYNWGYHSFWQYKATNICFDRFNGSYAQLKRLAMG